MRRNRKYCLALQRNMLLYSLFYYYLVRADRVKRYEKMIPYLIYMCPDPDPDAGVQG